MLCRRIPRLQTAAMLAMAAMAAALSSLVLLPSCSGPGTEDDNIPTVWYVNPESGSDEHSGRSQDRAWKTFAPVREMKLGPGDQLVIAPGHHPTSLNPKAAGSAEQPAIIRFLPGSHEFGVDQAVRKPYFISNACHQPDFEMPIGILLTDCRHLQLLGGGTRGSGKTTLMMMGRMTHFINDHCESILYRDLVFDLKRPTVSEFRVLGSGKDWSDIEIAAGSTHHFDGRSIRWTGDIGSGRELTQQAIPAEGRAWRLGMNQNPIDRASRIEALGDDRFRLHFDKGKPLVAGHQFQIRLTDRTVVGAHNRRSKDISLVNCEFHALAGMGIISQFTENLHYERVRVVPPVGTLRSCPAWADVFHFSGCRGRIQIEDCEFSGTQDDPVNVHGTHLRIAGQPADNQLLVEFVHPQTYGFAAFQPGDEVAIIHAPTLREHPRNPRRKVTAVERVSDRQWRLTLDGPSPHFESGDVVDNISWYPDVTIRGCHVEMGSTRGFLITTRGEVRIENNSFHRCRMPALLVEGDANGWFESGPVRDMLIRNNTFTGCDIRIHPRVSQGNEPVHENIRIMHNTFREGAGIDAHHASGLVISHNRSEDGKLRIRLDTPSTEAVVTDNR